MEMDTYTSFAVSMAAYVRLSLLVDAGAAMGLFLNCDFEKMRHSLRRGDLVAAAGRAVRGLGPGAGPGNRVSIGVVPCGEISRPLFPLYPSDNQSQIRRILV